MSAQTKWTPGPWHRLPGKKIAIGASGVFVCTVRDSHPTKAEAEANALLIAAAPDLAEALAAIERAIHSHNYFAIETAFDAGGFARAALAKARGESA